MSDFLERIRNKPPHVKGNIAFMGALVVTGVIASLWSLSLPARIAEITNNVHSIDTENNDRDVSEENNVATVLKGTREQFDLVREVVRDIAGDDDVQLQSEDVKVPVNVITAQSPTSSPITTKKTILIATTTSKN